MKPRLLLVMLALLVPIGLAAQYFESGTTKTNSFYNYSSGGTSYSKTEVWYAINVEQDGQVAFATVPLGNVRINGITLYALNGEELVSVASGGETLTVDDVQAGVYQVKISGRPTDSSGRGGNFTVSYLFTPARWVNDPEPNNAWQQAPELKSGAVQYGHLGYKYYGARDTEDWYRIDVPDEGTMTFTTTTETSLRLGSLNIYMVNADGTDVVYRTSKDMDGYKRDTTIIYNVVDVAPGTYYIKNTHYWGYGSYKLTYNFTPSSFAQDGLDNNTWQQAVALPFDQTVEGRMGYFYYSSEVDNDDWYTIDVKEDGKLTFVTKSETTLRLGSLSLYTPKADATDVVYRTSKDMDAYSRDTTIVFEVPNVSAGVYYVRQQRYNGNGGYQLTCYFTSHSEQADPEPNNTWDQAILLKTGPSVTGQLGYDYQSSTDTKDWYKIEVPDESSVTFTTRSETTLRLGSLEVNMLNAEGTGVTYRTGKDMDGHGLDTTMVVTFPDLAAGTYYILLNRYNGYGTYTLQYICNPNSRQADPEPNNTWQEASLVESGVRQQGRLGYSYRSDSRDTQDWFRMVVPDEGSLTFSTSSETTLRLGSLNIYMLKADSTNVEYRTSKDMDGYGKDTTVTFVIPNAGPGTYWIKMDRYNGYGGYDLDYTFTPNVHQPDVAGNDTWQKASLLESNTTQEGRLGYFYRNSEMDNDDWYKIEVPDEGSMTFNVTAETTLRLGSLNIYMLNADGTDVSYRTSKDMDAYNKDTTILYVVPDVAPGTYYIRQTRYNGNGGYKMQYVFTPSVYGADMAGSTWQEAAPLESGTAQNGRLGYYYRRDTFNDKDFFKFDVSHDGAATFSVTAEKTLRLGSLTIYTLNDEGNNVNSRGSKDMDAYNRDTTITFSVSDLAPGTYYARMNQYNGYGGYVLHYEFDRNPYDRDDLNNSDFASRATLEEGKMLSTTLGYSYNKRNDYDWYDLGDIAGRQIDVTITPDTIRSLVLGVVELCKYNGMTDYGDPKLTTVASSRLERSQGTISYVHADMTPAHYVVKVPRYNGYGGYTIIYGDPLGEGEVRPSIALMTGGRNTVRKGVACENTITISNLCDQPSKFTMLSVDATDNIDILGFRLPNGDYIPADSAAVTDSTYLFFVPRLEPWEQYTFTMISEGRGDYVIEHAPEYRIEVLPNGTHRIFGLTTGIIVSALGSAAVRAAGDATLDWIANKLGNMIFDPNSPEAEEYAFITGKTIEELGLNKNMKNPAVYAGKGIADKALDQVLKKIPMLQTAYNVRELYTNAKEALGHIGHVIKARIDYARQKKNGYGWADWDEDDFGLDLLDSKVAISDMVASWDPNEMVGPQGIGDEHYIGQTQTVNYRILFENKAEAGDAAYRIRINDELDENIFDVSTVRFGETSHDGVGYNWKMIREGNTLKWDIEGIELPPNVNAPEGEGYVSFRVDLKPGLSSGTEIKNKAVIIFDKNFPIETNEFVNTLDLLPPTTVMASATKIAADSVRVECQSLDDGSGVSYYLLFASRGEGDYQYMGQYYDNVMTCPVEGNATDYSFYVLTVDEVGNMELVPPQPILTGIRSVRSDVDLMATMRVYTLDGRYVGNSLKSLSKGIYVVNGRKYVVK